MHSTRELSNEVASVSQQDALDEHERAEAIDREPPEADKQEWQWHPARFSVVPLLRTPRVDPGGEIKVDVYFTGSGKPESPKLHVLFAHPELLRGESRLETDVPEDTDATSADTSAGHCTEGVEPTEKENSGESDRPGIVRGKFRGLEKGDEATDLTEVTLDGISSVVLLATELFTPSDPAVPSGQIVGEALTDRDGECAPPLQYTFNTDQAATPGTYELTFSLSYAAQTWVKYRNRYDPNYVWTVDQHVVEVHINSKAERYHWTIWSVATVIAILGLFRLSIVQNVLGTFEVQVVVLLCLIVAGLLVSYKEHKKLRQGVEAVKKGAEAVKTRLVGSR